MPGRALDVVRILAVLLGAVGCRSATAADDFVFRHENVMGTALELRVRADDASAATWAEDRVLHEIDRLSAIFSGYDRSSEFSRWQARTSQPIPVSIELWEVLQASDHWRAVSGGAFDPRVQALTRLWSDCAAQDRTPTLEELAAARALMRPPAWRLDPEAHTAQCLSDCPLSLNAIAKGYIIERACDAAMQPGHGVRGLLLNLGGDLRVCGDLDRLIGIAAPSSTSEAAEPIALVAVRDRGVATSGNYQRGFSIKGQWHSHIFDPRTGLPTEGATSATVIAQRSADADALATILNVLPIAEGLRLVNSLPGTACLIVAADGRIARSDGWRQFERAPLPALAAAPVQNDQDEPQAAAQAPWGNEFELALKLEINGPEGNSGRYRRPYVAVWVEDKDGFPVRNLALWISQGGPGPWQWLPDLKRWYRAEDARRRVVKTDMVQTLSQATRPPGQHSLLWDGKDDQGKLLPPGDYTLQIEAAREHGTYQNIRKSLKIGREPFVEELKGNVEIKSAAIEYRRKPPAK